MLWCQMGSVSKKVWKAQKSPKIWLTLCSKRCEKPKNLVDYVQKAQKFGWLCSKRCEKLKKNLVDCVQKAQKFGWLCVQKGVKNPKIWLTMFEKPKNLVDCVQKAQKFGWLCSKSPKIWLTLCSKRCEKPKNWVQYYKINFL